MSRKPLRAFRTGRIGLALVQYMPDEKHQSSDRPQRLMPSQRWATGLRNIPNAPWVGIHRELQDRLVTRQ